MKRLFRHAEPPAIGRRHLLILLIFKPPDCQNRMPRAASGAWYCRKKTSAPIRSNGEWGLLLMRFFQCRYLFFHLYCRVSRRMNRQSMKHRAYRTQILRQLINDVLRLWPANTACGEETGCQFHGHRSLVSITYNNSGYKSIDSVYFLHSA